MNTRQWSQDFEKECREWADLMGLSFMVCAGTVTTFAGHKSIEREATEEEIELWYVAGGPS